MEIQTSVAPSQIWLSGEHLRAALQVPRVRLPAGDEQRGLVDDAEVRQSGARSHRLRAVRLRIVVGAAREDLCHLSTHISRRFPPRAGSLGQASATCSSSRSQA